MSDPTAAMGNPGTALVLPDDIMADLIRAQAGSITTAQPLPEIGLMGAGVGLYEFSDTKGRTEKAFHGIVLNNHSRNILWDKPMGQGLGPNGEKAKPACSSNNGEVGIVREGFAHAGLPDGEVGDAEGTKRVVCKTCPYNKFGTGQMFKPIGNPRGKAVANQRAVYIAMNGVAVPYRLVLPPTSLAGFDEYLMALVARSIPVQTVITEFTQAIEEKNGQKYAVVKLAMIERTTMEQFTNVMTMRKQWEKSITPAPIEVPILADAAVANGSSAFDDFPAALQDKDDGDTPLPF